MRRSLSGAPSSSIFGKRASSRPSAMRPSMRATFMPTQTWSPWPKATWRLGFLPTSKRSGSGNCAGSWFAAPMPMVISVSAGSVFPLSVERRGEAAVVQLDRPVVAQHLLDRRGHERGIGAQPRQLTRVVQQQPHAVADEVGGGLVPRVEQEDALVVELLVAQLLAVLLALDEPREHVGLEVAGVPAPRLDQHLQVRDELRHRAVARLEHLRREPGLEAGEDGDRPAAQRPALGVRDVEQVADHLDRDLRGERRR